MLQNIKIAHKICALVLLVSLVGIVASFYASSQLQAADDGYSEMVERLDKSALYLARLNRSANAIGFNTYRAIVYNTASLEVAEAAKAAGDQAKNMNEFYDNAASRLSDRVEALQPIKSAMDQILSQSAEALKLALANQNEAATQIMRQIDPIIVQMTTMTATLNDDTIKRVTEASSSLSSSADRTSFLLVTGTIGAAAIGLVLSMIISAKGITGPLQLLRLRMAELAGGRLDVPVEGQDRGDEVGAMAKAVQVFKDAANQNKQLEAEAEAGRVAQAASRDRQTSIDNAKAEDLKLFVHAVETGFDCLSAGDLTVRMNQAVALEFEPIRAKFNDSVTQLEDTIGSVVGAVGSMRVGLNQITVAAGDLSQRTEQQAASLEQTVAALGEVVRGVDQTAQSADDARAAALVARKEAEKGGKVVSQAVAAMAEIEQSSNKISSIISVIDEIAFQTNLLALNAGVEAARAGEAGRGFAVVAQEVRGLAQRSAEAAKEIKDLISTSSTQVANGVDLVSASGRSLDQIVTQVGGVSHVISQMAQSAREQAISLKEVSTAADQMDKVTQQNAAMVEETTAAAQSLSAETEQLAELVENFRTKTVANKALPSPAHRVAKALSAPRPAVPQMRTTGHGGAAPKAVASSDSWEEF